MVFVFLVLFYYKIEGVVVKLFLLFFSVVGRGGSERKVGNLVRCRLRKFLYMLF